MSFVGRRKCSNSARSSFGTLLGAEKSTAQFFVAIRLVTVRIGFTSTGNSAAMIPSASDLLSTILAEPPSALNVLEIVFWKGVGRMIAAGTQMRVIPESFRTSTRVVTSKVRQSLDVGSCANSRTAFGSARLADAMLVERRKSRRFMSYLYNQNCPFDFLADSQCTPDSARKQRPQVS